MRLRAAVGVLVLVGASVLGVAPVSATAKAPELVCGDVTTDVALSGDLTCSVLDITATNLTIDLRGHTLTTTGTITDRSHSARFTNGKIVTPSLVSTTGPISGLYDPSAATTLDRVTVTGNLEIAVPMYTSRTTPGAWKIIHSRINGGLSASSNVTIDRSTISGHVTLYQFRSGGQMTYAIANSTFGAGLGVFAVANEDGGPPFPITSGTMAYNKIIGGLGFSGLLYGYVAPLNFDGLMIVGNKVSGSGGDGIFLNVGTGSVTLTNNVARNNGGHGINVVGSVIDGGNNRARHNALAPQCIGVVC